MALRPFDNIRADETLKAGTLAFLQNEIRKDEIRKDANGKARRSAGRPMAWLTACASIIIVLGLLAEAYFAPVSYLDLDVNPSVGLVLNRFDRVIDSLAYNPDGETVLLNIGINHMRYDEAVSVLIEAMTVRGFEPADGLISVTLQSENGNDELMLGIIEQAVREQNDSAVIEAFPVDGEVREEAHGLNLSPAKYLAIQELIEADPSQTVEGCRDHSIGELKELAGQHGMMRNGRRHGHH